MIRRGDLVEHREMGWLAVVVEDSIYHHQLVRILNAQGVTRDMHRDEFKVVSGSSGGDHEKGEERRLEQEEGRARPDR